MGMVLAAGLGLAAFAVLRQGQASASTLTSARITGFQLKNFSGGSLGAAAKVEFSNTDVNHQTTLQALGLNVVYNDTVIGTVHLVEPQTLPANQDTTVEVPVSIKLVSLLTQMALTGKVPALATFTSLAKAVAWLQQNVATEELRMQGTAQVDGLVVRFDQPLNLADYVPAAPPQGPVDTLPGTRPQVRTQQQAPGAAPLRPTVQPRTVQQRGAVLVNKVKKAAPVVRQASTVLRDATSAVRDAASAVKSAIKHRPANSGQATAGKKRKPVKPPKKRRTPDDGLPKVNLPVVRQ